MFSENQPRIEYLKHELRNIIQYNQFDACKLFLDTYPEFVDQILDEDGHTGLALASRYGHETICSIFMEQGANPTHQNKKGHTADSLWSKNSPHPFQTYHERIVELVDSQDYSDITKKLASNILKHPHFLMWKFPADGTSYLEELLQTNNYSDYIKHLFVRLPQWADIARYRDRQGYTLLHYAARNNLIWMLQYLPVEELHDANNESQEYPITLAINHGFKEFCTALYAHGISLSLTDQHHNSLLHIAYQAQKFEIALWLLSCGVNPNKKNKSRHTAEHYWLDKSHIPIQQFRSMLLDFAREGQNIKDFCLKSYHLTWALDEDDKTFIIYLVLYNNVPLLQQISQEFPQMLSKSRDHQGLTALHWAAILNHIHLLPYLLPHIPVDDQNNLAKTTALMLAAYEGHNDFCLELMKEGSDRKKENFVNKTAEDLWLVKNSHRSNVFNFNCPHNLLKITKNHLLQVTRLKFFDRFSQKYIQRLEREIPRSISDSKKSQPTVKKVTLSPY